MENLEFFQRLIFEFKDSLKNNGTEYFLVFDDSCERICISVAFVDIATARRLLGLSTIYLKQNLFHRSKLGRHVELQDTHIVICDVMQVSRLSAQLGFGSELVGWYRDATSLPYAYGHLLINLSPRADGRLRYCTNT